MPFPLNAIGAPSRTAPRSMVHYGSLRPLLKTPLAVVGKSVGFGHQKYRPEGAASISGQDPISMRNLRSANRTLLAQVLGINALLVAVTVVAATAAGHLGFGVGTGARASLLALL